MDNSQESTNQDTSLSLPIKISFTALKNYLNREYAGKIIRKPNPNGKEINYFKILDIDLNQSPIENYNIELIVKLKTLTTFYNKRELQLSIQTFIDIDIYSQKFYIKTYKIDSQGKSWIANKIIESVINTFVYQKIIKKSNIELSPLINEKIGQLNEKLASEMEIKNGISILGALEKSRITHFMVKERDVWVIININGWGVIEIKNLDF